MTLKAGDLIILPQDGLCEILTVDGMGAMVHPLGSVRLEFETVDGEQASFSRYARRPFLISNTSTGE